MERKLHRAIKTINGIKYEYIGPDSYIPEGAEKKYLKEKYIFDWCVKESFNNSYYFGEVCSEKPEYGRIIKLKGIKNSDLYFSENIHLENKLSDKIIERYDPDKSHKTTSGNEFSSGKFYSVASSSRFAVCSFSKEKSGKLDYIESIKINNQVEKIIEPPEFEHDTPINGIAKEKHCPQLDFFCKTNKGTYFFEVKNHEILDRHKYIELSSSYMYLDAFSKLELKGTPYERVHKEKNGKVHHYISLVKEASDKKDFLLASDFGCNLMTFHFDFKQFLCHLMGIYSYAMNHKAEQIFFYYLIYKNELYEKEYCSELYTELEKEIKTVFDVFGKRFPFIHFGLCYNNKYDTLAELQNII